jgi:restriction system protein
VLRAMGYGGSSDESAQKLGQSGDQGVDGVIREDELGLDLIYVHGYAPSLLQGLRFPR